MHYGHIGPVVPGRHTHLTGEFIDAEDGTSLVAARNHQLVADSLDDIFLALSLQVAQFAPLHPLVNLAVDTHGAHYDTRLGALQCPPCHHPEIVLQAGNSPMHTSMLPVIEGDTSILQRKGIGRRLEHDKLISGTETQHHRHHKE